MSDTFDTVARAVYDALEGPISSQDFVRQMAQWERAKKVARAAMDAMQEAERASGWGRYETLRPLWLADLPGRLGRR